MEGAEVAAGAGLVGADLGMGGGGAVEAGGAEPCVDMHDSRGGAQVLGEFEGALGTTVAHRASIERHSRNVGQIDGHEELVVRYGIHIIKSCVRAGDAQEVAVEFGSDAGRDMARPLSQQQLLGAELPQGSLLIPAHGTIVPVGFDEGVARGLDLYLFGGMGEADVDGLGQMRREAVGEGQLVAVFLLRRRAGIGRTVGVFLDLLAVEHYIYLVAPLAVL